MLEVLNNIYLWMMLSFGLLCFLLIGFIFLIMCAKKTHMVVELKGWLSGKPIGLFFKEDGRTVDWEPVKVESGIVDHKAYGNFIANAEGSYVDKRTRNVLMLFDSSHGASVNMYAAKVANDLGMVAKTQDDLVTLSKKVFGNLVPDSSILSLRTNVRIGGLKAMLNAMSPQYINSKIERTLAQRMGGRGNINIMQVIMLFVAILGAIIIGFMIIKFAG